MHFKAEAQEGSVKFKLKPWAEAIWTLVFWTKTVFFRKCFQFLFLLGIEVVLVQSHFEENSN